VGDMSSSFLSPSLIFGGEYYNQAFVVAAGLSSETPFG
jgi:hypothetical protein